ncbi:hypothetical protein CROQUDRAFT_718835 [Cronartium quercuum f. sp. fusiforme G11]|uniref:Sensitive to high expression protein 9, mitochondrial n=1 Tax=Cronartium quercuum f. sp. fusiforme G11 TaxID=708437 RepID=A0A9P6N5V2_9BASI|nr:hypothetical protein CROQUDRAFT_718835 [Cronartium quercuum f. sp. fusiforme G11]
MRISIQPKVNTKISQQIIKNGHEIYQKYYTTTQNESTPKPIIPPTNQIKTQIITLLEPIQYKISKTISEQRKHLKDIPNKLSKLTGYQEIEKLKKLVEHKEFSLNQSRKISQEAKLNYERASSKRSESVKEVNDLLARKASWSDDDLARFTNLVRKDHTNEQEEITAKNILKESESKVETEFTGLMQAILSRYHEEQIWSDKIRSLSTTFSLSITLINLLVFLSAIVFIEPYKREKVVGAVEERMVKRDDERSKVVEDLLIKIVERLEKSEAVLINEIGKKIEGIHISNNLDEMIGNETVFEKRPEVPIEVMEAEKPKLEIDIKGDSSNEEIILGSTEGPITENKATTDNKDSSTKEEELDNYRWKTNLEYILNNKQRELEIGATIVGLATIVIVGIFRIYSR